MANARTSIPFRLSTGGLFYDLGLRLHLYGKHEYRSRRLVLMFTVLTWLPLVLLAALEGALAGNQTELGLLGDLKPHIRCLIVIPLFVFSAAVIDPIISGALSGFRESGIIADRDRPGFEEALAELAARRDSYYADLLILGLTAGLTWSFINGLADVGLEEAVSSWMKVDAADGAAFSAAGWWYLLVASPILQIMLYRCAWRCLAWAGFLYRFSRLELLLEPTHPDLAGGLGALKYTQGAFTPVFMAFSAMVSVSIAQEMKFTGLELGATVPLIIGVVIFCIVLDTLPLLWFVSKLLDARRRGRRVYGELGQKLR